MKLLIFCLSSLLVIAFSYYQVKIIHLQQLILVLLASLLIIMRFFKTALGAGSSWLVIFVITLFIQVLITASGAVFSPFFILIHLYVIGLSLFFNFWTAFSFLALEIATLLFNIYFNQNLFSLVKQDLASALLYFFSILVITPISKFISQQYHIKNDTLNVLFKELTTQESIIEQIDDFVLTTDKDLVVLQANDAAKKIVDLSKNNMVLTDLMNLIDEKGKRLNKETMSLTLASLMQTNKTENNSVLTIKDYSLKLPKQKSSIKIIIKVNPVINPGGSLEKIIFLIGQITEAEDKNSIDSKLQEAHRRYNLIFDILGQDPTRLNPTAINLYLQILKKYEQDILTVSGITLHPSSIKIKMADIFRMFTQISRQNRQLIEGLNIDYQLNLSEALQDEYRLKLTDDKLPENLTSLSSLSVTTDPKLLKILIEKTFDIATSVAYTHRKTLTPHDKKAVVGLELLPSDDDIKLSVSTRVNPDSKEIIEKLLDINNGNLETIDNLPLSSNLESYIIKHLTSLLNASFVTEYNQYNNQLSFNLSVGKYLNRLPG